jgi:hypothetical protein
MRLIKHCVRCNGAFPATKNMLVCGKCYGSQEDLELSRIIKQAKILTFEEQGYMDMMSGIIESIKRNKLSRGERA